MILDIVLHIAVFILCMIVFAAMYNRYVSQGSVKESLFGSFMLVLGFFSHWGLLFVVLALCYIIYSLFIG